MGVSGCPAKRHGIEAVGSDLGSLRCDLPAPPDLLRITLASRSETVGTPVGDTRVDPSAVPHVAGAVAFAERHLHAVLYLLVNPFN
jgi:hypothetical protein